MQNRESERQKETEYRHIIQRGERSRTYKQTNRQAYKAGATLG